jgi:selenocysteine lyase/cysteine desulfurase
LEFVFDELHARQNEFVEKLWHGLSSIDGVRAYGPPPFTPRTSTIAFTVEGIDPENVTRKLADQGFFTSNGNFYAQTVVERLGVEGLVRAGCSCYTTMEEVEGLIEGVGSIAERDATSRP